MATDNAIYIVTKMEPFDVSGIRDPGVQALVLLAVTLGWGIRQKPGNPAVLIADDGMQKRLPTDSSIRISVFQQALSTIMTHTDENILPTIELIDEIIAATKPSTDHQRRLRLALGETPQEHRQRVENSVTPEHRPDPRQEHLMQTPELPEEWTPAAAAEVLTAHDDEYVPADGGDHGELLIREPTKARSSSGTGRTSWYQSDTSYERHWADGYIDFECQICGKAHTSSRGIGAHSQVHDRPEARTAAKSRAVLSGKDEAPELVVEWEEPDPGQTATVPVYLEEEPSTAQQTLDKVINLVVPSIIRERDNLRHMLDEARHENVQLRARNQEVEGDFDALMELMASRRKPQTERPDQ